MKANLLTALFRLLFFSLSLCIASYPALAGTPAAKANAVVSATEAQHWNTEVENWVRPQPGWLYVLDPKPDTGGAGGRVWLVDPSSGKVMGSIRTGDHADFALSPDGTRLYVASMNDGDASELAVIDTALGEVLKSGIVNGRAITDGLPPFSTMAVSGDGLALSILIDAPKSPDKDALLLAAFDTRAGEFLQGVVHLGNCGPGRFISYPTADHIDFLCPRTNRVRLINVDADSRTTRNADIVLPWERRIGVAEAIEPAGAENISIIRGDGGVVAMDTASQAFAETIAKPTEPNRVPPAAWPLSPDGSRVYLGYNNSYDHSDNRFYLDYGRPPNIRPESSLAGRFHVYDTSSWRKIGTIKTKMPFWSAVAATDGKTLYAMAPHKHSILVIDTEKMHQVRDFKVGGSPALALVAP
jgi:hypothetical protein